MCKKNTSVPYAINRRNFQVAGAIYAFESVAKRN